MKLKPIILMLLVLLTFQSCVDFDQFKKNKNESQKDTLTKLKEELKLKQKTIDSLKILVNTYKSISDKSSNNLVNHYDKLKKGVLLILGYNSYSDLSKQGSAFLISSDGVGITNFHVISDCDSILALDYLGNKHQIKTIIKKDEDLDFVLFKIESGNRYFNYCKIADYNPKIGESCFAITNPHGLENSLSTGVVSAYRGNNKEIIQTSTLVSPGSSGGPLFNKNGKVIGITTLYIKGDNLTFAINVHALPINKILKENY